MSSQSANVSPAQDSSDRGTDRGSNRGSNRGPGRPAEVNEEGARAERAHKLVRHNVYWALGMGLVPIPVLDFVALTAVQVKMLKELSDLYEVKFFDDKAKTIIGALVTGTGSLALTGLLAGSFVKVIPVVGQLVGFLGLPLIAGGLTLAIGNLFTMHYESGGTLLDFDPEKMRAHFQQELERAKSSVKQMQAERKDPRAPIPP